MVDDNWQHGDAYERYVGRWSTHVAREFVEWLDVAPGARWVDVGAGTGALSAVVIDTASPSSVDAVEPSASFVATARARLGDRVTLHVASADHLPLADGAADILVAGLVLNFIPDLRAALAEMRRVAAGGVVAAYVWDYEEGMQMMRYFWDAAIALGADASVDEATRFPVCSPDGLRAAFVEAGFEGVDVRPIVVPTNFVDFDDLWVPFTGGTGSAPAYLASLSSDDQDRLRDLFREQVPVNADGSITLSARAWAVRGLAPR